MTTGKQFAGAVNDGVVEAVEAAEGELSAALDLAYVATGRFDAYIERSVNWWDIAAGVLLVKCAGGQLAIAPSAVQDGKLSVIAWNGKIDRAQLTKVYP